MSERSSQDSKLAAALSQWLSSMGYAPQGRYARVGMPPAELLLEWTAQAPWLWKWLTDNVRSDEEIKVMAANLRLANKDVTTAKEREELQARVSSLRLEKTELEASIQRLALDVARLKGEIVATGDTTSNIVADRLSSARKQSLTAAAQFARERMVAEVKELMTAIQSACSVPMVREGSNLAHTIRTAAQLFSDTTTDDSVNAEGISAQLEKLLEESDETVASTRVHEFLSEVVRDSTEESSAIVANTTAIDLHADAEKLRLQLEGMSGTDSAESKSSSDAPPSESVFAGLEAIVDDGDGDTYASDDEGDSSVATSAIDVSTLTSGTYHSSTDPHASFSELEEAAVFPSAVEECYKKLQRRYDCLHAESKTDTMDGPSQFKSPQALLTAARRGHLKKFYATQAKLNQASVHCEQVKVSTGNMSTAVSPEVAELQTALIGFVRAKSMQAMAQYHADRLRVELQERTAAITEIDRCGEVIQTNTMIAAGKVKTIRWLIRETDATLTQLKQLHAQNGENVKSSIQPLLLCLPEVSQDLKGLWTSETDYVLSEFPLNRMVHTGGKGVDDQLPLAKEHLLVHQFLHRPPGPLTDVLKHMKVPSYMSPDSVLSHVMEQGREMDTVADTLAERRALISATMDALPGFSDTDSESTLSSTNCEELLKKFADVQTEVEARVPQVHSSCDDIAARERTSADAVETVMAEWWELPGFQCPAWVRPPGTTAPLSDWMAKWAELSHLIRRAKQ